MSRPHLTFWFEFASTYSYLSAMRLPALAEAAGVKVTWRPFLLGPIFAAQGWETSPFNLYQAKGAYMWRDMQRQATRYGLTVHRPDPFPQNGLQAARVAQKALETDRGIAFCQAVYSAQFARRQDISDPDVLHRCLRACDLPATLLEDAQHPDNKSRLRNSTEAAQAHGIFGAPSFTIGDELFWGDDRLEEALDWAQRHG